MTGQELYTVEMSCLAREGVVMVAPSWKSLSWGSQQVYEGAAEADHWVSNHLKKTQPLTPGGRKW